MFYLWGRRAAQRSPDEKPTRLDKLADKLPEFSRDTAPEWWAVAQRVLLFTYPEPEQITELADLVTADSHKTSPGVIRFRIRKVLKERFSALAPL